MKSEYWKLICIMILLTTDRKVQSKLVKGEDIDYGAVVDFFADETTQLKQFIGIPIKLWTGFLAIVLLSIPYYYIRGEEYFDDRANPVFLYNVQSSATWAAQHTIKNLGYAGVFAILLQIFGIELEEIDVKSF